MNHKTTLTTLHLLPWLAAAVLVAGCADASRRSEIDARRDALKHKQDSTLLATQQELAVTDSLLQAVSAEHDRQHAWVMDNSMLLTEQSPEVLRLNRLRLRRDSLQNRWQTLGAKIEYIKRKR